MNPFSRAPVPVRRFLETNERREAGPPRESGPKKRPDSMSTLRAAAAAGGPEEHVVSLLSPHSFEADQYRLLRHFLEQARAATGLKVVAITSPSAGDGKTTTAVNLAVTLAQSPGSRVLIVDTDLRRPRVAASLGLGSSGVGLVGAVLDERLDLGMVVRSTPYNLAVLPAGTPPPNAYQVLDSSRVGQLLEQARNSYDYVVLDTPPVLLVPDCRLMSQSVDRFLLVVAAHQTSRKLMGEALSAMDEGKVLGIVLNGDDSALFGYRKRHYSSYYHERSPRDRWRGWSWWRGRGQASPRPWR
jgi:capsular exopolysaccharide synthesis family protein